MWFYLFLAVWFLLMVSYAFWEQTKDERDFHYCKFWQKCSEKRALKALRTIAADPNLNIKTFKVIDRYSHETSTPLIEAQRKGNVKVAGILFQNGCR